MQVLTNLGYSVKRHHQYIRRKIKRLCKVLFIYILSFRKLWIDSASYEYKKKSARRGWTINMINTHWNTDCFVEKLILQIQQINCLLKHIKSRAIFDNIISIVFSDNIISIVFSDSFISTMLILFLKALVRNPCAHSTL